MYFIAYAMQLLTLICALGGSALALLQLWQQRGDALALIEKVHWAITGALSLAAALLLHALFWNDFSLVYVASYTDRVLPAFYRLTAFWAGQPGSMLFWAFSVAISGSIFALTPAYKRLTPATRLWYWGFFYAIMAFFALILSCWSNPFEMQSPVPPDGNGLNPLLQNPGMIFHPPLLFLGYGGFTVPACLALAQSLSGGEGEDGWHRVTRPVTLLAWAFLTAGIILGMWWAYMELGWGGYWAWDPVENASLIPWLISTAALHTLIVQERRNKLHRVNVALMCLTTISAFFATYLVRSGVVQSVHAFGDGSVGTPLTVFVLGGLLISFWAAFSVPARGRELAGIVSREGFLVMVCWLLLALSVIILVGTMWPVISLLWTPEPHGLDANFYNRVCVPLGMLIMLLLMVCPWLRWDGGLRDAPRFWLALGAFVASGAAFFFLGYRQPVALLAAAGSVACLAGLLASLPSLPGKGGWRAVGAAGLHVGLAVLVLGMAFSGPYKQEYDLLFQNGKGVQQAGAYRVELLEAQQGRAVDHDYLEARLKIYEGDTLLGELKPQRRMYDKFGTMQFSEVDVVPGLGNELYASFLGLDENASVLIRFSVEPLVNWMWIGGTLMCLFPFLMLARGRKKQTPEAGNDASADNGPQA